MIRPAVASPFTYFVAPSIAPKLSPKPEIPAPVTVEDDDEELKQLEEQLRVNLDADYFKWKDEQEEQEAAEEKEKSAGFQNKIKNLIGGHPHDDSGV